MKGQGSYAARRQWLELEMGFEWSDALCVFVNPDLEAELRRGRKKRVRAPIIASFLNVELSFSNFQRTAKIVVDRARVAAGIRVTNCA